MRGAERTTPSRLFGRASRAPARHRRPPAIYLTTLPRGFCLLLASQVQYPVTTHSRRRRFGNEDPRLYGTCRKTERACRVRTRRGAVAAQIVRGVANLRARKLADWTSGLPARPPVDIDDATKYTGTDEAWKARVRSAFERSSRGEGARTQPVFVDGVIASSDGLIKDPDVVIGWLRTARNILAVEMESAGVYRATDRGVSMLAIRGISDVVGFERDERWTRYACASAAAFTRAYLATMPIPPSDPAKETVSTTRPAGTNPVGQVVTPSVIPAASPFLTAVAKLQSKTGTPVPPLSWQLRMNLRSAFVGTKAEMHEALRAAALSQRSLRAITSPNGRVFCAFPE